MQQKKHKPIWQTLLLFSWLILLIACDANTLIQDSRTPVPSTPTPTATAPPTPESVAEDASGIGRAYIRAWEAQDYLGMYSLLSPQSQALVDSTGFVNRYDDAMRTATITDIHAQPIASNQTGDSASFGTRVTFETAVIGAFSRDFTIPLVYRNGRWGIVWNEGLILPELMGGNRLHLDHRIPSRANIYDFNGRALAYQGQVIALGIVPGQIEDEEGLLTILSDIFNQPPEDIQAKYADYLPDWYAPIGDIPEETMQTYLPQLQPYIGKGLAQPQTRLARLYPEDGVAPHLVGYTGLIPAENVESYLALGYQEDETVGLSGLEAWGEEYLNGERGGTLQVVGANGEYISTIQERDPKQARSIYTTLDRDFQLAVEQALNQAILTYPIGSAGSVVVLEANTGRVLAMASYPTYSPYIFDSVRPDATNQLGAILTDPNQPLLNRATQGAYPAGSTFKIISMAAALQSGLYTADSRYTSTGTWDRLGETLVKRDWREGGHGTVSLVQALTVSCNSCFYDAMYNVDAFDTSFFPDIAQQFGLGELTGIVGVQEASGLIPNPDWKLTTVGEGWARGDAVNMAIGQGYVQVTPLQMAMVTGAVANGGTLYRPTIIDRIGEGGGAPVEEWPTEAGGLLPLSPDQLASIQQGLWEVTNNLDSGTAAFQFDGLPVVVAGKTGTAEDPPRTSHAWFIGYAPASPYNQPDGTIIEQPEIAVAVMIENAGEGSAVAAPIFRRIIELYYGIEPVAPYPW